jgi:Domain of unknown function (DUF4157)
MSRGFQRQSRPPTNAGASASRLLQRCSCGLRSSGPTECTSCKEKKRRLSRRAGANDFDFDAASQARVADVLRLPGQPLDAETRAVMGSRFGRDFSRVRVHTDMAAAETAVRLKAEAYTVGRHIVFAPGRYAPSVPDGQRLLAHELTHVLQQDVVSDPAGSEISVGPVDDALEREAERVADLVMAVEPDGVASAATAPSLASVTAPLIQRKACGPKVDNEVTKIWEKIGTDFNSWNDDDAHAACRYLVQPLVPDTDPEQSRKRHVVVGADPIKRKLQKVSFTPPAWNTDAFDTLPLYYYGAIAWLMNGDLLKRGCCIPSISEAEAQDPDNLRTNQAKCEDDKTCCSTVQIDNKCWLSGTVNYGTYGVMVRLCHKRFPIRWWKIKQIARDLAVAYKRFGHAPSLGGATTKEPDYREPLSWYDATVDAGPTGRPGRAGNRPECELTCPLNGSIQVVWDYVWEPVKKRTAALDPQSPVLP